MKPTRTVWPVYGFREGGDFCKEPVAHFFSWTDAARFASVPLEHGAFEHRNLYMAATFTIEGGLSHANS
jgi:hypothetical protein